MSSKSVTYESRPDTYPVASITLSEGDDGPYAVVQIAKRSLIYSEDRPHLSETPQSTSVTVQDSELATLYLPVEDTSVLMSLTPEQVANEIISNPENYDFHAPLSESILDVISEQDDLGGVMIEDLVNDVIEDEFDGDTFSLFGGERSLVFSFDGERADVKNMTYSVQALIDGTLRSLRQSSLPRVRRPVEV